MIQVETCPTTECFKGDETAQQALAATTKLAAIDTDAYDTLLFPGGHGPLWDLAECTDCKRLIETFVAGDRPVEAVYHAPAVFRHTTALDGRPMVSGRRVTGFSNSEEMAVGLSEVVPFLLKEDGGHYEKGTDWSPFLVADGKLVTGQNLGSSEAIAKKLLELIH